MLHPLHPMCKPACVTWNQKTHAKLMWILLMVCIGDKNQLACVHLMNRVGHKCQRGEHTKINGSQFTDLDHCFPFSLLFRWCKFCHIIDLILLNSSIFLQVWKYVLHLLCMREQVSWGGVYSYTSCFLGMPLQSRDCFSGYLFCIVLFSSTLCLRTIPCKVEFWYDHMEAYFRLHRREFCGG